MQLQLRRVRLQRQRHSSTLLLLRLQRCRWSLRPLFVLFCSS